RHEESDDRHENDDSGQAVRLIGVVLVLTLDVELEPVVVLDAGLDRLERGMVDGTKNERRVGVALTRLAEEIRIAPHLGVERRSLRVEHTDDVVLLRAELELIAECRVDEAVPDAARDDYFVDAWAEHPSFDDL